MAGNRGEPLTREAFLGLVAMLGLDGSDGHLEALYPEVMALLDLAETVHAIDASSVLWEHAVSLSEESSG